MNKLTVEYLTGLVDRVEYVHQGLLTISTITLKSGTRILPVNQSKLSLSKYINFFCCFCKNNKSFKLFLLFFIVIMP